MTPEQREALNNARLNAQDVCAIQPPISREYLERLKKECESMKPPPSNPISQVAACLAAIRWVAHDLNDARRMAEVGRNELLAVPIGEDLRCFSCGIEYQPALVAEACPMAHREHWSHEWVGSRVIGLTKKAVQLYSIRQAFADINCGHCECDEAEGHVTSHCASCRSKIVEKVAEILRDGS